MIKGKVLLAKETASSWGTKNPHAVGNVNQAQGPRTGNAGSASKRSSFLKEKEGSGNERSRLADFVMSALEKRDPRDFIDAKTEPLDANRGPKSNPTAGGTEYNVRKPQPRKITR